jgi:hypothetical protein
MNEQKRKFSETIKKIDSPLAKYPFWHFGFRLCIAKVLFMSSCLRTCV